MDKKEPAQVTSAPQFNGLAVASLVTAFFVGPAGVILGIMAINKARKAGQKSGLALAGIIVGAFMTLSFIVSVTIVVAGVNLYNERLQECRDLIPGSNPSLVSDGMQLKCSYKAS